MPKLKFYVGLRSKMPERVVFAEKTVTFKRVGHSCVANTAMVEFPHMVQGNFDTFVVAVPKKSPNCVILEGDLTVPLAVCSSMEVCFPPGALTIERAHFALGDLFEAALHTCRCCGGRSFDSTDRCRSCGAPR